MSDNLWKTRDMPTEEEVAAAVAGDYELEREYRAYNVLTDTGHVYWTMKGAA